MADKKKPQFSIKTKDGHDQKYHKLTALEEEDNILRESRMQSEEDQQLDHNLKVIRTSLENTD